MMKNYILMLGIAGVALGSYCAYAGNSATMTVTATIAHDVSLSVVTHMNLGTITINPAYTSNGDNDTEWTYSPTGSVLDSNGAIVSIGDATVGVFTANVANPSACDGSNENCGGLVADYDGFSNGFYCNFNIKYSGSGNIFNVFPYRCTIMDGYASSITAGTKTTTLTIEYTPS